MNVYDFDKTICCDDTETDFFFFELKRHPINWLLIPYYFWAWFMTKLKVYSYEEYRNHTYLILKFIKDLDKELLIFWEKRKHKICTWYKNQQKEDDVIISATPRFLYEPYLKELKINHLIASDFDLSTRKVIGKLYYGEEKVKHFKEQFPDAEIDEFYTDSLTDLPLLKLAKKPFLIDKKYNIIPWKEENKNG